MMRLRNILRLREAPTGKNRYNWMQFFAEWRNKPQALIEYFDCCSAFILSGDRALLNSYIEESKSSADPDKKAFMNELHTWIFPNSAKLYRGMYRYRSVSSSHKPEMVKLYNAVDVGDKITFIPPQYYKLQHWTYSMKIAKEFAGYDKDFKNDNKQGLIFEATIKKDMMIYSYAHLKPMIDWLKENDQIDMKEERPSVLSYTYEKEVTVFHDKAVNAKVVYKQ